MRYCDKCGCAIEKGGHKSAAQGLFSSPFLCDECYAAETDAMVDTVKATSKAAGCFAKVFVGVLSGLGVTVAICNLLPKVADGLSDDVQKKIAVGIEVMAIVCFIASKIGSRILGSKFFAICLWCCGILLVLVDTCIWHRVVLRPQICLMTIRNTFPYHNPQVG